MCRSRMAIDAFQPTPPPSTSQPHPAPQRPVRTSPAKTESQSPRRRSPRSPFSRSPSKPSSSNPSNSGSGTASGSHSSGYGYRLDTSVDTAASGRTSLPSLRFSLPEYACIYDFSEIRSATNNFLARRYSTSSSSSQSWRCELNGKDVIIFQRRIQKSILESELKSKLSVLCKSHHLSIIKLLGASVSNDHIYLVYVFVNGSNLADCLRNPRNPSFTALSTWMSRMQIATDLAHGLDYIHHTAGFAVNLVHKHVKSSGIIVVEPGFNARICHFGAAELCSETESDGSWGGETPAYAAEEAPAELRRSESRGRQFEGVRGYMSPEFKTSGVATVKSDVYAFGVVILELLSGEEPVRYRYDKASGEYRKICVIESARQAVAGGGLRRWVDRRLEDSFPVEAAEKLTRLVLECVHDDPDKRPDMKRVAGKISKLYLESKVWSDRLSVPTGISVSFAPR